MSESLKVVACADHGRIVEVAVQPLVDGRWKWGKKIYVQPCPGVADDADDPAAWLASLTASPVTCELVTHRYELPRGDRDAELAKGAAAYADEDLAIAEQTSQLSSDDLA